MRCARTLINSQSLYQQQQKRRTLNTDDIMSLAVCGYHGDGHFNEDAPRPPVPGEEDRELVQSRDGTQISKKTTSHWAEGSTATPRRSDLNLGFEPEGSASRTGPYEAWAETLLTLLDDRDGTTLFQHFLRGLGCSDLLDFWFACSGFRKFPAATTEQRLKLAKAIYRCYLSERSHSAVSRQVATVTRCGVLDAIQRSQLDSVLFAQAHAEVQAVLEHSLFPLFLRSDVYLKHSHDQKLRTKLPASTDHQNTVLLGHLDTPSPEKGADPETESLPSYNTANQKSPDKKCRQRCHTCHHHMRTTRVRESAYKHLPHTPVKMRTHTFAAELMRRLQELQTQTLPVEEEADVIDRTSLCHSEKTKESSTPSLGYCDTDDDITQLHETREVKSPRHKHVHTNSTDDALDCSQTDTKHYGCAGEIITVVYYFCGELVPYRTCVEGNTLTLGQFKSLVTRRGWYRFFFKRASSEFECGVVYEEIREDESVLPTYDHKIIAKVERMNK
nr:axin-1-like isoform X2 [Misgurnus anguillicaudatus]